MPAVNNHLASNSRIANLFENLTEGLTDSVTFDLMTQAVLLNCGHFFNETTVVELSKDPS